MTLTTRNSWQGLLILFTLGILVLMPVKHRLEGALDRFFARRVVEF